MLNPSRLRNVWVVIRSALLKPANVVKSSKFADKNANHTKNARKFNNAKKNVEMKSNAIPFNLAIKNASKLVTRMENVVLRFANKQPVLLSCCAKTTEHAKIIASQSKFARNSKNASNTAPMRQSVLQRNTKNARLAILKLSTLVERERFANSIVNPRSAVKRLELAEELAPQSKKAVIERKFATSGAKISCVWPPDLLTATKLQLNCQNAENNAEEAIAKNTSAKVAHIIWTPKFVLLQLEQQIGFVKNLRRQPHPFARMIAIMKTSVLLTKTAKMNVLTRMSALPS